MWPVVRQITASDQVHMGVPRANDLGSVAGGLKERQHQRVLRRAEASM